MRWGIAGNILLLTFSVSFSQTYIVKLSTDRFDATQLNAIVQQSLRTEKTRSTRNNSFSVAALAGKTFSPASGFPWNRYAVIKSANDLSEQTLRTISADPSIEYIQKNNLYSVYSAPNDSAYGSQWNLKRIGVSALYASGIINPSIPVVRVGVIDTGIDELHPDLVNSIAVNSGEFGNGKEKNGIDDDNNGFVDDWRGYDFVEQESREAGDWTGRDNDPSDENGHGTAVAGIIGARSNNGIGITGIAPVKLVPLRAFGKNGNGNDIDIASAIIYAADNGVDVINMSFGDVVRSSFLHDAIHYAYAKNVVMVASSGNDGSGGPHYPSDFSEVISTGSVGRFDTRSFFSSHSPSLDMMAPGEQISTTTMGGGYTGEFAGTSAAAPHVSGVAALVKSFDQQKKLTDQTYPGLSNEEIRGILLNSADDAGEPGWDGYYGAGILNAQNALLAVAGSAVTIHSPGLDEHISSNSFPVIITAISPYLESVSLFIGSGENPTRWDLITESAGKFYSRDTITTVNASTFTADQYVVRLVVKNSKGSDQEFRQRISIDRSPPKIRSFRYRDSVIIGDLFGALIEARTDRNTTGKLFYRKTGESSYRTIASSGLQKNHSFILTTKDFLPATSYEFYCQFTENSATAQTERFPTIPVYGKDHFSLILNDQPINSSGFDRKSFSLPKGFLLNSVVRLQSQPNIIMNEYSPNDEFGKLTAFVFSGNAFTVKDSSSRSWVPRAFQQRAVNNVPGILVQEHGVSQLLRIDTVTGEYFRNPVWGDSTDVWASTLNDLDGDGTPEIIARSSSEFLVYKKSNSGYSIAARLSNPSQPLPGDARNQFGPPRSLVGDFTGIGRNEIIFADYDGDLLFYRQTAPPSLNFTLIGIDTTDLFEMSDFVTSGDFTGDGIMDFAVAGHSNLDWNSDKEYDAPVWTVRVFSHTSSDPAGKVSMIWKQDFVGVKAGSGYDNSLSSGRLRTSDTRDALFISFNPHLYIFEWNAAKKIFESRWQHPSQTNSVISYDFDQDGYTDLGFNTNGSTEFWSLSNGSSPSTPYGLSATSLSSTSVRLSWFSSASSVNVYRGKKADSLQLLTTVNNSTILIDSTVTGGVRYFYSVSAVAGSESQRSDVISVVPHGAPSIISVEHPSPTQLAIGLSADIESSRLLGTSFIVDSQYISHSVTWKSPRNVIATFQRAILPGIHSVKIRQLTDQDGMTGDTMKSILFTTTLQQQKDLLVRSVNLLSGTRIRIEYSEPVQFTTATMVANYSVRSIVRSYSIGSIDSLDPQSVVLNIIGGDLARIAVRIEVAVSDSITSLNGIRLNSGKGQVVSVAQETQSLGSIVVYPNPASRSQGISFVNIPAKCRITIYSPGGEKIIALQENTTREGISWDLRSESGNLVSSGIYLYRVEQMNDAHDIINTTIGKFAVIR